MKIRATIGAVRLRGELYDGPAARALAMLLPVKVKVTRWGEEYYGTILPPLGEFTTEMREEMAVGDLAYWEPGDALCLFFGPTPASIDGEPRAASPVHLLGNVVGDWEKVTLLGQESYLELDEEE